MGGALLGSVQSLWQQRAVRWSAAAFLTVGLALTLSNHTARGMIGFAVANATGMLDARSPGERQPGALTQTKLRRHQANPALARVNGAPGVPPTVPHSQVLGQTRSEPGAPSDSILSTLVPANAIPQSDGTPVAVTGGETNTPVFPLPAVAPVAPAPSASTTPTPSVTPPVSPIPEPGTYVLLTVGIGLIGWVYRHRRIRKRSTSPEETGHRAAE